MSAGGREDAAERDPPALGMTDRFMPGLPRSTACALPAAGRLGDAPVDGQFLQHQAGHAVVGVAGCLLQLREDARLDPLVAALADGGGAAGAVGDGLVRAAEAVPAAMMGWQAQGLP
jgi:hypothetical protein